MKRNILIAVGAIMLVMGVLFGLQGIGVIGGSAMSGTTLWSVLGPLIALAGLVLLVLGVRTSRPQ